MIKKVSIENEKMGLLEIILNEAYPDNGIMITAIDGLGPVKADVNTQTSPLLDGSSLKSVQAQQRNVVFHFLLSEAITIEDSRQRLYRHLPLKEPIKIIIQTDNRFLSTKGIVESVEPDIFSSEESVSASIICPNSYWIAEDGDEEIPMYGVDPLFEFIFSNESLTEPLLEFGEILEDHEKTVYYNGGVGVGMVIKIVCHATVKGFTFYKVNSREKLTIDDEIYKSIVGSYISKGDEITINTNVGSKNITVLRNGKEHNILGTLIDQSWTTWPTLQPGENTFYYSADIGSSDIDMFINYKLAYLGV